MAPPIREDKNEKISLGLHPQLLRLVDIAAHNDHMTRAHFIRQAIAETMIRRGAIQELRHNEALKEAVLSLSGDKVAPGSSVKGLPEMKGSY